MSSSRQILVRHALRVFTKVNIRMVPLDRLTPGTVFRARESVYVMLGKKPVDRYEGDLLYEVKASKINRRTFRLGPPVTMQSYGSAGWLVYRTSPYEAEVIAEALESCGDPCGRSSPAS